AIAQINEHDPALVAIRVHPAAKRYFLANMIGPQLAASMSAKQNQSSDVNSCKRTTCAQGSRSSEIKTGIVSDGRQAVRFSSGASGKAVRHIRLLPGAHAAIDEQHLAMH